MGKRTPVLVASATLVAVQLLVAAGVAHAAGPVFTITADRVAAVPTGHNWAFNDFFPRTATVAQGDTIEFANQGFHTVTLLPPTVSVVADMAVSLDRDDTKPNPNLTRHTAFDIGALMPQGPTPGCGTLADPCAFDGTAPVSSGAPLAGPPAPFEVTITAAPGTYTFHCRIHQRMTGTLTVVASGAGGTTDASSADVAATAQAAADVTAGLAVEARDSAAGVHRNANGTTLWTIRLGDSTGDGRVALLEMLPSKVSIKPGDVVVWRPTDVNEIHTVTFPADLHTDTLPMCESTKGTDVPAHPTVIPPTGPRDFACGNGPPDEVEFGGGNGVSHVASPTTVSDSGIVAYRTVPIGFGLPASTMLKSWAVRFGGARAGTYHYVCQIHEGMAGTIVVH